MIQIVFQLSKGSWRKCSEWQFFMSKGAKLQNQATKTN